jgi:hypothetical protein
MIAFFARVEKYCFLSCLLNKTELRFTDFWVRCENISLNIPKGKLFPYIIYMIHVKVATFTVSFRLQSLKIDVDFGLRRLRKLEPSLSFGLRRLRKLVRVSIPICAGCASQPESQFRFAQLAQVSPDVSSDLRKLRKLEPTTISDLRKRNPSKPTVISDGRQQYPVKQNISSDFHRKKCTNGNIYFKRFKIKI